MDIRLRDMLDGSEGWGHIQGSLVRDRLATQIAASPLGTIIRISLCGITRTDVPFARAAVVDLARSERTQRGFCLMDMQDVDIVDNWNAAALSQEQPLTVWHPDSALRILGPQPSIGVHATLLYILSVSSACTYEVAHHLCLHIPNASNKLKHLWQAGYVLRQAQCSQTGGTEYEYRRIV